MPLKEKTPQPVTPEPQLIDWTKVGLLVAGQAATQGGGFVLLIAMTWTAVQLGGTTAVSLLLLSAAVPRGLVIIFGGAVTDMLGPRYVVLRTTLARAVVLLLGAFVVFRVDALWPLIVISALEGILFGLGGPASTSLMPHLAKGDYLGRANSLYSMVLRIAPVVGVPVGAWMIGSYHLGYAVLVSTVTTLLALCCLLYVTSGFIRPARDPGESMLWRSTDGLRLLAWYPRLRWLFVASFTLDLAFNWPLEVALPLLVSERGWEVGVVGIVAACFGVGALVSSGVAALLAHRISVWVRLVLAGLGLAVGIFTMALLPSATALYVASFAVGLMFGFVGPAVITLYQEAAPQDRMGTVMSLFALSVIGTAPLSIAVFSGLSLLIGVSATWGLCGIVAFGCPLAAAVALRRPVLGSPGPGRDGAPAAEGPAEPAGEPPAVESSGDGGPGERSRPSSAVAENG